MSSYFFKAAIFILKMVPCSSKQDIFIVIHMIKSGKALPSSYTVINVGDNNDRQRNDQYSY